MIRLIAIHDFTHQFGFLRILSMSKDSSFIIYFFFCIYKHWSKGSASLCGSIFFKGFFASGQQRPARRPPPKKILQKMAEILGILGIPDDGPEEPVAVPTARIRLGVVMATRPHQMRCKWAAHLHAEPVNGAARFKECRAAVGAQSIQNLVEAGETR